MPEQAYRKRVRMPGIRSRAKLRICARPPGQLGDPEGRGRVCGRMSRMPELVHYAVSDAVATVTLDSQHNRNALSRQLVTELFEGIERAAADDRARVVLLAAEGRVFCSGADLSE